MKTKHATARIAQIEAHNARVETIRNKSLSDEAIGAIDDMITNAESLFQEIMESVWNGCHPCITIGELSDLRSSIEALRREFKPQEISEYLLEQAEREAEWDDE